MLVFCDNTDIFACAVGSRYVALQNNAVVDKVLQQQGTERWLNLKFPNISSYGIPADTWRNNVILM